MTTLALRSSPLRRPSVRMLLVVIVALLALVFFEWRSVRTAPVTSAEADTMCMAARIGLPCRS